MERSRQAVLIHRGAAPHNLLASTEKWRALLDWNDEFHDPVVGFAKLPLRALPCAIDGYLSEEAGGR